MCQPAPIRRQSHAPPAHRKPVLSQIPKLWGCLLQAAKYFTFIFFGLSVFVILVFGGFVVCHCYRRLRYDRQRARDHEIQVRGLSCAPCQVFITGICRRRWCHNRPWEG